jgi:Flp pilus assembly protein TadG
MMKLGSLGRDQGGAAVVEMAIALPVLTLIIYGIFQVGVAFQASAGMQHALGEGARLATICYNPTPSGCSVPSDAAIKARISDKVFGTGVGTFNVADPVNGTGYKDLSVTFTMPTNFLFFQGPNISMTRTKRVYVAG